MTEPVPVSPRDTPAPPPERVHVAAETAPRPTIAPLVYLAGLIVLAVALFFLWRYPSTPRRVAEDSNRLGALQDSVQSLSDRISKLEARPTIDLGPLEARIAQLEQRPLPAPAAPAAPPPDIGGLSARIDALAAREDATSSRLTNELGAVAKQVDQTKSDVASQVGGVANRLATVETTQKSITGLADKAERMARVQAASTALDQGTPLGQIPDAPPALAQFATKAPPTEAALRLAFPTAAAAAQRASQPAITDDKNVLERAWVRVQQSVTVRQGDRVMLGDPIAGVLSHAQEVLDAGDLAGCLTVLQQLAGPAKAAMADWTGKAQALIDARTALASMAAHG